MKCTSPFSASGPLPVSMSSIDDLVDAIDEDDVEDDDFLLNIGELDPADNVPTDEVPDNYAHQQRLIATRKEWRTSDIDCGSPDVQVAGMTERITYLTRHLKEHPKDFSTKRGLLALVNKRRKLLNYLYSKNPERYAELVAALGVRHKPVGRVQSRSEKYGAYPQQKPKKIKKARAKQ